MSRTNFGQELPGSQNLLDANNMFFTKCWSAFEFDRRMYSDLWIVEIVKMDLFRNSIVV